MIANFLDPIAGFSFSKSQIWIGRNNAIKIKTLNAAFFDVWLKNKPIPEINSSAPKT